ncbi:MAG TPA: hypothetical protein VIP09_14615 [Dehalococcoidia bacterium]
MLIRGDHRFTLPAGHRVWDADVREDGFWAIVIGSEDFHADSPSYLRWPDGELEVGRAGVRIAPDGRFVVTNFFDDAPSAIPEPNCRIYDVKGNVHAEFFVGGPHDVLVGDGYIVTTYSDQAIFGNSPAGRDGICAFDLNGEMLWGYDTDFADVSIYDCYAACIDDDSHLLAFPYAHPNFPLLRIDVLAKTSTITPTPKILHGAKAITTVGETILFCGSYRSKGATYAWTGTGDPVLVGSASEYVYRGLRNGRFISRLDDGFSVWTYEPG